MSKIIRLLISIIALVNLSTTEANAFHVTNCQLPSLNKLFHQDVGWPRDLDSMNALGKQKVLVLIIDFPDSRIEPSTSNNLVNLMELNTVRDFYLEVSNKKFDLDFFIYPKVVNLNKKSDFYGGISDQDILFNGEYESHIMVRDSLDTVANTLDLSNFAGAIVVVGSGTSLSGNIASATSVDPDRNHVSGKINNYVIVGEAALRQRKSANWRILVHEINHLLGITDLYLYSKDGWWQGKSPGPFGQQGFLRGDSASDSLAYNRWLRGWISDQSIKCIGTIKKSLKLTLHSQSSSGPGYELILYRLNENQVLVFESPKEIGFSSRTHPRSLLIYTVDNSIPIGEGPVRIIPKNDPVAISRLSPSLPDWERFKDAALLSGDSIKFKDFVIINRTSEIKGDVVNFEILVNKDAIESTIKCVRFKEVLKVTGYLPRCPAGFRSQ